jgi:hypothetical protein
VDQPVWTELGKVAQVAHNEALLEILIVVAAATGLTEINGSPLRDFYNERKRDITEKLIREIADTDPTLASQLRAAWEAAQ